MPDEGIGCGFTEAVRGVLSHHMVIRDGKIANYHPYPPTPWNANPRDSFGTPGPYEDAVQGQPIFEENDREHFKGIDIMRTVRSFDPCLPCGVHMYLGDGKKLEMLHTPDPVRRRRLIGGHAPPSGPAAPRTTSRRPTCADRRAHRRADRRARGRRRRSREPGPVPRARRGAGPDGHRPLRRRARAAAGDRLRQRPARRGAARPAGRRRAGRQPAAGARPAPLRRPDPRRARPGRGAALPRHHGGDVELLEVTDDGRRTPAAARVAATAARPRR